ncbi:MAG TPA: hypothetical protein VLA12_05190 [Planctomycetaceae bacterium]|nr:hypothetical protein [Planctomycetaceae bacterium]
MFECPLCEAEIEREITSQCPECGTVFCVHCHITVAAHKDYTRCNNPECRYYGKMLCEICLMERENDDIRAAMYGGLFGLVIAGIYIGVNIARFDLTMASIAAAIVFLCAAFGYFFHIKSSLCPRCEVDVNKQLFGGV